MLRSLSQLAGIEYLISVRFFLTCRQINHGQTLLSLYCQSGLRYEDKYCQGESKRDGLHVISFVFT